MELFSFLSGIFSPLEKIIDDVHTSDEERLTLQAQILKIQNEFSGKVLEYERLLLDAQARIITAEATGQSWVQRNWRPITMLTFLVLVVGDSLGLLANRLAPEAWTLLQLGLGGYVIGRSAEKVLPKVAEVVKENRKG